MTTVWEKACGATSATPQCTVPRGKYKRSLAKVTKVTSDIKCNKTATQIQQIQCGKTTFFFFSDFTTSHFCSKSHGRNGSLHCLLLVWHSFLQKAFQQQLSQLFLWNFHVCLSVTFSHRFEKWFEKQFVWYISEATNALEISRGAAWQRVLLQFLQSCGNASNTLCLKTFLTILWCLLHIWSISWTCVLIVLLLSWLSCVFFVEGFGAWCAKQPHPQEVHKGAISSNPAEVLLCVVFFTPKSSVCSVCVLFLCLSFPSCFVSDRPEIVETIFEAHRTKW